MRGLNWRRLAAVILTSGMVSGAALLTAVASARALGATGRGELATVIVPFQALVSIVGGGVPYAVASLGSRPGQRPGRVESTGILMALALGALAAAVLIAWARVFGSSESSVTYVAAAACIPSAITIAVFLEYERQRGAGRLFNSVRFVIALLSAGCTLTLAVLRVENIAYYVLALAAPSVVVLAVLAAGRIGLFRVPSLTFHRDAGTRIWGAASRAWPSAVTDTLLTRAAQLVLVLLVEPESVGVYAVAVTVAESGGLLRHAIVATYYEKLADDRGRALELRWRSLQILMFSLTIPAYALIALACHFGLTDLLGNSFASSSKLIVILLMAQIALDLHLCAGTLLLAQKRPGLFSGTSAVAALIHIAILVPAVYQFGVLGACYATLLGYACAAAMTRRQASRLVRNGLKEAA